MQNDAWPFATAQALEHNIYLQTLGLVAAHCSWPDFLATLRMNMTLIELDLDNQQCSMDSAGERGAKVCW